MKRNRKLRKKRFLRTVVLILVLGLAYFTYDYVGPSSIPLREDTVFGFSCLRARDLIVQEFDTHGDLWATRGMLVYRLKEGETRFKREAHVPTGLSLFWLRNFTLVRRLTIRPECVEMTVTDRGDICALSAGYWWVRHSGSRRFVETMEITNYGFGDQGVRNDGLLSMGDSTVFYAEYFQNPAKEEVRIYRSTNDLKSWETAFTYPPDEIRHIHAIQHDPYTGRMWICTGDLDRESSVSWTDGSFDTIHPIGWGSQIWRVCQLVFTPEHLYWGTDTGDERMAGIYRWNRQTEALDRLYEPDGAIFYGITLADGTIVMSSDREGMANEKDDRTRLYVILPDDKLAVIDCGTWHHHKPGFWFKFAKLRFQRDCGAPWLVISCLNQKELPDGDLIIIHEDELLSRAKEYL